jgi:hypothetical protein
MDADNVFDRVSGTFVPYADMIRVLIKKTQATTLHIRGRDIEDENGLGDQ